jgi:tRNA threonylcarbamoyladenosine biosynthesis protein TsaB
MNILAIETATPACAMGVATNLGVVATSLVDGERRHTEALAAGLADLLERVGLSAHDIDRVVVDRGPGLFTGLRVGVATALGLALATRAQLVGVTSLELLAYGAFSEGVRGTLVSCVDGRRGEVFVQTFALDDDVSSVSQPVVTTPGALVSEWRDRSVTLTGDGFARYEEVLVEIEGASSFHQLVPPTREALRLGAWRETSDFVAPLYLREPDAVANFTTRQRPT